MRRMNRKLVVALLALVTIALPIAAIAADDVAFMVTKQQILNAQSFAQHLRAEGNGQLADAVLAASSAMQRNDPAAYNEAYTNLKELHSFMSASALAEAEGFARGLPLSPSTRQQVTASDCDANCVFGTCSVRNCNGTANCGCTLLFFPSCSCTGTGGYTLVNSVPALSTWALIIAGLLLIVPALVLVRRRSAH